MASFEKCVQIAAEKMNLPVSLRLKSEQEQALRYAFSGNDVITVLPTGYGKSLIYQMLPFLIAEKYGMPDPMIVIVVGPINAIMEEQVRVLRSKGIMACYLSYCGFSGTTFDFEQSSNQTEVSEHGEVEAITSDVPMKDLVEGKYNLIYSHPECLLKNKIIGTMLRSEKYQQRLCGIVVDEVHMIIEWGEEFRPYFKRLGELTCLHPHIAHIALTATAKPHTIEELAKSLMYTNHRVIRTNPDRPNIYLHIESRPPNIKKIEKFNSFVKPLADQLCQELEMFPLTIAYVESLEALGYCYRYVSCTLKHKQYNSREAIPENRLFCQFHTDYTADMKRLITTDLSKSIPTIRLVLATVALGMGLNAPSVERVMHMRPPVCLESYLQEIGRAGRSGENAQAIMFYNNSDIASNRKGITEEMIKYCKNTTSCLRLMIVQYFGFDRVLFNGLKKDCCKNCRDSANTT